VAGLVVALCRTALCVEPGLAPGSKKLESAPWPTNNPPPASWPEPAPAPRLPPFTKDIFSFVMAFKEVRQSLFQYSLDVCWYSYAVKNKKSTLNFASLIRWLLFDNLKLWKPIILLSRNTSNNQSLVSAWTKLLFNK
jgi:hypothetical protein